MARAAPAADRAASIIAFLTANRSRGFTLSELVRHLGMNIASAHATLAVLCDFGFLLRDPVHRTYVLGPALAVTGFAALEQHPAINAAIDQAEMLSQKLDAEVCVSAIAGRDVVLVARRGPLARTSSLGYPGDRAPMLAPYGAIFMAWAGEDAVAAWLTRADAPDTAATHYYAVLADIRERGFSVPLDAIADPEVTAAISRVRNEPLDQKAEEHLVEVLHSTGEMVLSLNGLADDDQVTFKSIAAPIFDPIGQVLLSLSITGTGEPETVARVIALGRQLAQAAAVATRRSRGRVPTPETAASAGRA
jgi:DNA-binding IclR family transcriptional regulator